MLETIKQEIDRLPDISFADYYQQYVITMQDQIMDYHLSLVKHQFNTIEDIPELIKGINKLSEEMR